MRRVTALSSAVAIGAVAAALLTGCETTRTNKMHAAWQHMSDVTTTPHPEAQTASLGDDWIPPVPGSPTGAGPDGRQPFFDSGARKSPGSEKGRPMQPREQPVDKFVRQ